MHLSDFDYKLPRELIAQAPLERRDESRLLVMNRETGNIQAHRQFRDLIAYLEPGDLIVVLDHCNYTATKYLGSA